MAPPKTDWKTRLDELSDAWNKLRNKALGQGLAPNVPQALADQVGREYERFREFRRTAKPETDMFLDVAASKEIARYERMLAKTEAAGIVFDQHEILTSSPLQKMAQNLPSPGTLARNIAIGFGVAGAVVLTWFAVKGSRRGNGY